MRLVLALALGVVCTSRAVAEVPQTTGYRFLYRVNYATGSTDATPLRGGTVHYPAEPKGNTRFLRFEFPARESGEGLAIPLSGAEPNRVIKASLMLRGRGTIHPVIRTAEGRSATPAPVVLTKEWAWVELIVRTGRAPAPVVLELPNARPRAGDFLEVQRVTLHAADELSPNPVEVAPVHLPAAEYAPGGAASFTVPTELRGIPFPRTSRPVTLWMETVAAPPGGRVVLLTREGPAAGQILAEAELPSGGGWLSFAGLDARVVGSEVSLRLLPGGGEPTELGEIVFSTDGFRPAAGQPVRAALPSPPAVRLGERSTPPGLNEADWAAAPSIADFRPPENRPPLAGATTLRALLSPGWLHLRFKCEEPLLRVAEQKVHEFQPARESVVARLRFAGGEARLRVDATGKFEAEWRPDGSTVFSPWASGATATTTSSDGGWEALLSVPVEKPQPLEATLLRESASRQQSVLWHGLLFPGAGEGTLNVRLPDHWQVGPNRIAVENAPDGEWLFHLRLEEEGGRRSAQTFVQTRATVEAHGGIPVEIDPSWGGKKMRVFAAFLGPDLAPLRLFTPQWQKVEMPSASLSGGRFVWLNGKAFTAPGPPWTLPLQRGVNEVIVRVADASTLPNLAGEGFGPVQWQRLEGPLPPENRLPSPVAEDAKAVRWSHAVPEAGPALLRARLLREETRLWPTPQPAWFAAEGTPQHLAAIMEGAHAGRRDWSLCLALPEALEFVAASSFYADRSPLRPRFATREAGSVLIDDQPHRLVRITADKPLPRPGEVPLHERSAALWFFLRPRPGSAGQEGIRLHYWAEAEEGSMVEARRSIPVRVLPPLAGRQPKRLHWQMWGPLEQLDAPEARAAVLEAARSAGITEFDIGSASNATGWLTAAAETSGVRPLLRVHFLGGSLTMGPYLRDHPDQRLILPDGKPSDALVCTSALLEEAWPAAETLLAGQIARFRPASVVYDYEYAPLDTHAVHSCYCPRCLSAFRAHAGLGADVALDGAAISKAHAEAWTDFMALQCARLFRVMKEAVHRIAPGTRFEVYSGYQTPDNPRLYGVDWRYVGRLRAVDRATMGYGRPLPALQATKEALAGIPVLFGEILHPFLVRDRALLQPTTAADQLRRVIDSGHGVLLYELAGMDGRSWQAVAETTRLVAAHEALFAEGERLPIPGVPEAEGVQLRGEGGSLYCVMNPGPEEKTFSFTLPEEGGTGFYTGERFGHRVELTLPPGGSRAIYVP